jgi:phosphoesterase RecJ-like protein
MTTQQVSLGEIAEKIRLAHSIVLSTHRQCDGDGLGCELALFFALKKIGKSVRVINIDETPKKYEYLEPDRWIQYFETNPKLPDTLDLTLIFDTNDVRLLEPLYKHLAEKSRWLYFIDHHPLLENGPQPPTAHINMEAASTGELVYHLIKQLGIEFDVDMARALYTSISFDTQLFRFIRNSPNSHLIAAELLRLPIDSETIHRHLFSHQTPQKIAFMGKVFSHLEYHEEGKIALTRISSEDLKQYGLSFDEVRDVTDQIMSINTIEIAIMIRQESPTSHRISMRSKGRYQVLQAAELLGGGGHWYAAGASYHGPQETLVKSLLESLREQWSKNSA